jgi:homoserine dehydrogenase
LQNIPSGDEFVKRLPEFDAHFDDLKKKALDEGNVLRYVGVIDVKKGEIKAELQKSVPSFFLS